MPVTKTERPMAMCRLCEGTGKEMSRLRTLLRKGDATYVSAQGNWMLAQKCSDLGYALGKGKIKGGVGGSCSGDGIVTYTQLSGTYKKTCDFYKGTGSYPIDCPYCHGRGYSAAPAGYGADRQGLNAYLRPGRRGVQRADQPAASPCWDRLNCRSPLGPRPLARPARRAKTVDHAA